MTADVLLRNDGPLGHITLNRPKALNALTHEMCRSIYQALQGWAADPRIHAVQIDAVPGRAFCAGGDIRSIYELGRTDLPSAEAFFATEYRLNTAIHHFPKPYIAILDGITMGGGAGLSVHGSHRVVTENTSFAMPETGIGLYPDVGGTYLLSRLPGETGTYLALTGSRIEAADMLWLGLATHYVSSAEIGGLVTRLVRGEPVDEVLADIAGQPPAQPAIEPLSARVDAAFGGGSVEEIVTNVQREGEWGRKITDLLATRSPTSLKLTLRAVREARNLAFDDCMRMEYRMTLRVLRGHDLYEGVRAILIDRDQHPDWRPERLEKVTNQQIDQYFTFLGPKELAL
ncbi:MAG TPA: enoyl-CoA hydratase/isomerase family protein [Micropepsaceae bacterium]|nr:enoyl-CoA hydratase/isomerase family protein [Micropepsaceae bacterium]